MATHIVLKNENILVNFMEYRYDTRLMMVLKYFATEFPIMTITENYRPARHAGDVHSTDPVRAVDIRSWDHSNPEWVASKVNNVWCYDPQRPNKQVCIYHNAGFGPHFHIQVHPNTARRNHGYDGTAAA